MHVHQLLYCYLAYRIFNNRQSFSCVKGYLVLISRIVYTIYFIAVKNHYFVRVENNKIHSNKATFAGSFTALFRFKKTETYCLLMDIYGDLSPSNTTNKNWFWQFNNKNSNVSDKEHENAPKHLKMHVYKHYPMKLHVKRIECWSIHCWKTATCNEYGRKIRILVSIQFKRERHRQMSGHVWDIASKANNKRFFNIELPLVIKNGSVLTPNIQKA